MAVAVQRQVGQVVVGHAGQAVRILEREKQAEAQHTEQAAEHAFEQAGYYEPICD